MGNLGHESASLNQTTLHRFLKTIDSLKSGRYQNDALKIVIPYLPANMLAECLEIATRIESPLYRVAAMSRIAQYAPFSMQVDILKAILPLVRSMETNRAFAIVEYVTSLIARLNDSQLVSELVEISSTITDASENVIVATALLPVLNVEASSSLAQTLIPLLSVIENDGARASMAMKLAPYVPPAARALLLNTHLVSPDSKYLEEYWVPMFSGLPLEWKSFVLDHILANLSVFGYGLSTALSIIVPAVPAELLPQTISKSLAANTQEDVYATLAAVAAYVPDNFVPSVFDIAIALPGTLPGAYYRHMIISTLAPRLSASQIVQALPVLCEDHYGYFDSTEALVVIAEYLPESALPQFLTDVSAIDDLCERARIIRSLLKKFDADILVKLIVGLPDLARPKLLLSLFPSLPDELLPDVVIASHTVSDLRSYFSEVGPHLDGNTLPYAIKMANQLSDPLAQVSALAALAPYAEPSLQILIFDIARNIASPYDRVLALQELAPYASLDWTPSWLSILMDAALEAKRHYDAGAPMVPGEEIHMPQDIDSVLVDVLFACKHECQTIVLRHLLSTIQQEEGKDVTAKASALLQLFACVPEHALETNVDAAIATVKRLEDDGWIRNLESVSAVLPTVFVQYALGIALRALLGDSFYSHTSRDRIDSALLGASLTDLEDPMASREGPVGGGMLDVAGSLFNRNLLSSRRKLYRRGTASIPASVKIGEVFFLRVGVVLPEHAGEEDLPIVLTPIWPTKIQIRVLDTQNAFVFLGSSLQYIELSLDSDSDPMVFKLQAKTAGNFPLDVEFLGRSYLLDRIQVAVSVSSEERTDQHDQINLLNLSGTDLIIPVNKE